MNVNSAEDFSPYDDSKHSSRNMLAEISLKNSTYICKDFKIHEYLSLYCEIIQGRKAKAKSNASTSCQEMALS